MEDSPIHTPDEPISETPTDEDILSDIWDDVADDVADDVDTSANGTDPEDTSNNTTNWEAPRYYTAHMNYNWGIHPTINWTDWGITRNEDNDEDNQ